MSAKLLKFNLIDCPEEYTGQKHIDMPESGGAIGRSSGCAFHLSDHNKYLSGTHALITSYGGMFYISDVSTNGTFVNGTKIQKNQPLALHDGDVILVGRYEISVSIESKFTATNIAADITSEGNSQDPLESLDYSLPPKPPEESGRIEDLFLETEGEDIDTEDPIAHLRFSAREETSFLEPESVEEPINIRVERQIQDDSDSIYSEMDMPNLIPEDWISQPQAEIQEPVNHIKDTGSTSHIAPQAFENKEELPPKTPVVTLDQQEDSTQVIPSNWEEVPQATLVKSAPQPREESPQIPAEAANTLLQSEDRVLDSSRDSSNDTKNDELARAFIKAIGGDVNDTKLMSPAFFEQMGGCLKLCLGKFSQDLNSATQLADNAAEMNPLSDDLFTAMYQLYKQDALMPVELIEQVIEEVATHEEVKQLASSQLVFEQSQLCDPVKFEEQHINNAGIFAKRKLWQSYIQHFQSHSKGFLDKNDDYFNRRLKDHYKNFQR